MKKVFARNLCFVMLIALVSVMFLNCYLNNSRAKSEMLEHSSHTTSTLKKIINDSSDSLESIEEQISEDYLTRCRALRYMIERDSNLLDSFDELENLKTVLDVDEIDIINSKGKISYSTNLTTVGYDMKSTVQTAEFLEILEDDEKEIVQEAQLSGVQNQKFRYAGISRSDKKGIIVIGIASDRYADEKAKKEIAFVFTQIPADEGDYYFLIDTSNNEILAHTNSEFVGDNALDDGISVNYKNNYGECDEYLAFGEDSLIVIEHDNDDGSLAIGVGRTQEAVKKSYQHSTIYLLFYMIGIFIIIIALILFLLEKNIVSGIHHIINGFEEITQGNLDADIEVNDKHEFKALSDAIKVMVKQLKSQVDRDNLTGLYCRRKFEELVTAKLQTKEKSLNAMIMFDLDNFKGVNDNYGHHFGDEYLMKMANLMMKIKSTHCYFGRRSGDEFYAFLYKLDNRVEARDFLEEFYTILEEEKMEFPDGSKKSLKVSAGVYCSTNSEESFAEILLKADRKLYEAKENNKGSYLM